MLDEWRVLESVREMRVLIRIGRERTDVHSPVRALFPAGETFRTVSETLDDLEREAVGGSAGADGRPCHRAT